LSRWLLVLLVLLVSFGACAPVVEGPADRQRADDRSDGDRLARQLAALPGVERAEVVLRRPIVDPLSVAPAAPAGLSVVVIVDDRADRTAIARSARALATTVAPGTEPILVVDVGVARPELATVGPFVVDKASRTPLKIALALALAVIAALASWIAVRERRARAAA